MKKISSVQCDVSQEEAAKELSEAGKMAGVAWATQDAEGADLKLLHKVFSSPENWYTDETGCAHSPAELLYYTLRPEWEGDRAGAHAFWAPFLEGNPSRMYSAAFVNAFVAGALSIGGAA